MIWWLFNKTKKVRSLTAYLGQTPDHCNIEDPRGVQIKELRELVHSEAWVTGSKSEGVSLQHQGCEAGKRAQGIQQGPLVLELTVPQVQTHQVRPEEKHPNKNYILFQTLTQNQSLISIKYDIFIKNSISFCSFSSLMGTKYPIITET